MRLRTPPAAVLIWLIAGAIAVLSCSLYLPAAHVSGEYLPVGNDSFYHARRILDTVEHPGTFYEFDPKIHAPEGSLLVWPWGYDYAMAQIVRLGLAIGVSADPMAILVWIPVVAVVLSVGLLVLVGRRLGLSTWPLALAALCIALAPTTQFLHGAGLIDHHYAEYIFVLSALAAGLYWLREPQRMTAGVTLGAILGIAPVIHNGLFILQLPLLVTLLIRWWQGMRQPPRSAAAFAATLLLTTTAILIPSTAFREGRFEFYTLCWFHLYIAFCTALFCVLLSRVPKSVRSLGALAIIAIAALLPILGQLRLAQAFVAGSFKWLEAIQEMKSPLREAFTPDGSRIVGQIYSWLIWIAPLTLVLCVVQCWRERSSQRLLFWVTSVMGLCLLAAQLRLHYFGNFALYLPWLILADEYAKSRPLLAKKTLLLATLGLLVLYAPALRQLVAPVPPTNDHTFKDTRPMFSVLQQACAEDPGIVLADNNLGHYIRYYTGCSVIADNFLLTPLHFRKMDEMEHLFSLSAAELLRASPTIKYVLVRPLDIKRADDPKQGYRYWMPLAGTPPLMRDLLFGPLSSIPAQYRLIDEIKFPGAGADVLTYARLYKIERSRSDSVGE
jgi:hypothetical protein